MEVLRYWAKATALAYHTYDLVTWSGSAANVTDAETKVQQRLRELKARVARGEQLDHNYPYGQGVLRERIIHELVVESGEIAAMVTQNRYGAFVLNTAELLMLDIDLPSAAGGFIARLFGRAADPLQSTLNKLRTTLGAIAGQSFRIYRTAAGLRVIGLSAPWQPGGEQTAALMRATDTDPAYAVLCRRQQCFRARLTPKPWRLEINNPQLCYPETDEQAAERIEWQAEYDHQSQDYAVCQLLETVGPDQITPRFQTIIDYHDQVCRVASSLPLA